jgi:hypothetical protein
MVYVHCKKHFDSQLKNSLEHPSALFPKHYFFPLYEKIMEPDPLQLVGEEIVTEDLQRKYTITSFLSQGSFSKVYNATQ